MNVLKTVAIMALVATSMSAGAAHALTANGVVDCADGTITIESSCLGAFDGNDSNEDLNGLFGVADWGSEIKVDPAGTTTVGGVSLTIVNNGSAGTWSATGLGGVQDAMLVLKAGDAFSAYLIDLASWVSGVAYAYDTSGVGFQNGNSPVQSGQGLSHGSLYVSGTVAPIPLPAAGWLLIAGAGALVAAGRRRKA